MNVIYKQLTKDIENEKKEYVKRQLVLLKDDIDNVFKLEGINKTIEDTLIVISNYEDNVKLMINGTTDEFMLNDLNKLLEYINYYFKYINYDGDKVNNNLLSNGMYYEDIEKEINLYYKACNLKNTISFTIKILSFIIWIISGALFFAYVSLYGKLSFAYLFIGICFGLILYGFAEIIQILHDIRRKIYKMEKRG